MAAWPPATSREVFEARRWCCCPRRRQARYPTDRRRGARFAGRIWGRAVGRRSRPPRGLGTDTLPAAGAVRAARRRAAHVGVLAVLPDNGGASAARAEPLLETFAGRSARRWSARLLARSGGSPKLGAETRELRNTLLASISHDLRTPLAVIAGAGSTLASMRQLDAATRIEPGALGGDQGARDVGAGHRTSRAGAPGIGPGGVRARLADAR